MLNVLSIPDKSIIAEKLHLFTRIGPLQVFTLVSKYRFTQDEKTCKISPVLYELDKRVDKTERKSAALCVKDERITLDHIAKEFCVIPLESIQQMAKTINFNPPEFFDT